MDDSVSFEILEDAEFEVISVADLDELFDMNMKRQHFGRMMIHDTWYASTYKRVLLLMGESAEERYVLTCPQN